MRNFFSRWNRNSCSFVLLLTFLFLFNGVLALHAQNVTISLDVKNKKHHGGAINH